jgi:hypothetical protein
MPMKALSAVVFASGVLLAAGFAFAGPGSTHAHDEQRKCNGLVSTKHIANKADRKAEFDKCMNDPYNYK